MFVVSGHLYRPLLSSQPCGLRVKIKGRFWDPPPPDVFKCRVKHPRVPLTPKPRVATKPSLILTLSPQGCDEGRGLYRWPETTNIYILIITGIVKQTTSKVAEKASSEVPKRTLGGQKLGTFYIYLYVYSNHFMLS